MAPRRGMMRRGPGAPTEKAKNFKGTLRELLKYMGVYKIALLFVLIFAVGSTVFTVVGPKILGNATTELFHGLMAKISGTGSIDFDKIGKILLGLIILYIVSALFGLIQGWLMTGISQKMCRKMRRDISEKINRMPLGYFESHLVGDVHLVERLFAPFVRDVHLLVGDVLHLFADSFHDKRVAVHLFIPSHLFLQAVDFCLQLLVVVV